MELFAQDFIDKAQLCAHIHIVLAPLESAITINPEIGEHTELKYIILELF